MPRADVVQLARAINLIATRCRNGIPALLGQSPRPSDREIYDALAWHTSGSGSKVRNSGVTDKVATEAVRKADFDETLELVAWPVLIRVVRKYARDPKTANDWKAYKLHCLCKGFDGSRFTFTTRSEIAEATGMSKGRVLRCIRRVPEQIAFLALSGAYIKLPLDSKH